LLVFFECVPASSPWAEINAEIFSHTLLAVFLESEGFFFIVGRQTACYESMTLN